MIDRRGFLRAVLVSLPSAGIGMSPAPATVTEDLVLHNRRYRLLSRLPKMDWLSVDRLRRPGGYEELPPADLGPSPASELYTHYLMAGLKEGGRDNKETVLCRHDIASTRPDPVLRVIGSTALTCTQAWLPRAHFTCVHFSYPHSLAMYVEMYSGEELVMVAGGRRGERVAWTAPPPTWVDGAGGLLL